MTHQPPRHLVFAVVHEPGRAASGVPYALELCGVPDGVPAQLIAARVAQRHRAYAVTVDDAGPGRHLLRLTADGHAAPGADVLADVLAWAPGVEDTVEVTGHQRDLIGAAVSGRQDRYVGQLSWDWSGPLDLVRFGTAWQSVAEREVVLRASFDWTVTPRLVLHQWAEIEVVHHPHHAVGWSELLDRDRRRGFPLHRPGLLRVTLLEGGPDPAREGPLTRVLLSYHRALLDERGVHLLLYEFYRAYVHGGVLPGGDRRPDVRDHAQWLARQHPGAARAFWTQSAPPADAAVRPGRWVLPAKQRGIGRIQRRLRPSLTGRLRTWAALRGAGESSVLHVAWALLLYQAAGGNGPRPVSFGVHHSGRDIPLEGAAAIPGLLGNPLPMTVTVDPGTPLVDLVRQVRDAALDLAAHAWVSVDQVRDWSGRGPGTELVDTLVAFDTRPEVPPAVLAELRAQGVHLGAAQSISGDTGLPLALVAHYDPAGGLALTAVYDREILADGDASTTLSHCLHLLRALPDHHDADTVGQVLERSGLPVGSLATPLRRAGPRGLAAVVLQAGEPAADVICLVNVAGVPRGTYEILARDHVGPERIVSVRLDGAADVSPATLHDLLGPERRLVVCGAGPGGRVAHQLATSAGPVRDTVVVMTGVGDPAACARALADGLESVRAGST